MTQTAVIAILSALAQEQDGLVEMLEHPVCVQHAGRAFWCGELCGRAVVLALSRIGKVAAATTAVALMERFAVRAIVFTGVAGGIGDGVRVGDVVVASDFVQHDMNAAPLFARYEVPLTGRAVFDTDAILSGALSAAATRAVGGRAFAGQPVQVHRGLIASGDQFVNAAAQVAQLRADMLAHGYRPLALEMEGAAVAQACADYTIPFAAVRTISDRADDAAHVDFLEFVRTTASAYARDIVLELLPALPA